jgi:hypothetical protein
MNDKLYYSFCYDYNFAYYWLGPIEFWHDFQKYSCNCFERVERKLPALGVWNNRRGTCWLCLEEGKDSRFCRCGGTGLNNKWRLRLLLLWVAEHRCHLGQSSGSVDGREYPSWCHLVIPCDSQESDLLYDPQLTAKLFAWRQTCCGPRTEVLFLKLAVCFHS